MSVSGVLMKTQGHRMQQQCDHISVCICTYKRPRLLLKLLGKLKVQETSNAFTYSVVIVDNDADRSAEQAIASLINRSGLLIEYYCQPIQNIALARNTAVQKANGDFIAFIDDDEFPGKSWLLELYNTRRKYGADGVLGPVLAFFPEDPPQWIVKGKFYERGAHRTGFLLRWQDTRSGNFLIKRSLLQDQSNLFNEAFSSAGEDMDFFKRLMDKKFVFVWCAEAPVYEVITAERCQRSYMLERARLRGKVTVDYSSFGWQYIAKSCVAIPVYAIVLPLFLVFGQHHFMKLLSKLVEHVSRVMEVISRRHVYN
jgi:succinoglycan biosynthesis protein ExoM